MQLFYGITIYSNLLVICINVFVSSIPTYEISAFDTSFPPWRSLFGTNLFDQLDKVWESPAYGKKSLKITKGQSESVNRRRTDNTKDKEEFEDTKGVINIRNRRTYNTMTKRKRTEGQTTIYKTLRNSQNKKKKQ